MPTKKIVANVTAAITIAATAGLAVAAAPDAGATGSTAANPNGAAVHQVTESSASVIAYWTKGRMAAAREATISPPHAGAAQKHVGQTHLLGSVSGPGSTPTLRPDSPTLTATPIMKSQVWTTHGTMPATTIGKLYFTENDGRGAECTATVINSNNHSMIWTASHCVDDGNGHWFSKWQFVPDYHDGVQPLGVWTAKSVTTRTEYKNDGDPEYDFAAITLKPNAHGVKVGDATGSQGYHFNGNSDWNVTEFGYPYDTHPARSGITGQQLRYCIGHTWESDDMEAIQCDMGHGASGGPWLDQFQSGRGWGYLVGDVSRHYADWSYVEVGPILGDAAIDVYNDETNA